MYSGYFLYSASYSSCILAIFCILSVLCLSSCILQLYPGCILQLILAIFSILQVVQAISLFCSLFWLNSLFCSLFWLYSLFCSCILAIFTILQLAVFWLYSLFCSCIFLFSGYFCILAVFSTGLCLV